MGSEKNQTSFLEEEDGEFRPFALPENESSEVKTAEPAPSPQAGANEFSMSSYFWSMIDSDSLLKEELERQIEDRSNAKVIESLKGKNEKAMSELEETARQKGHQEGLAKGLAESKVKIDEMVSSLESTVDQLQKSQASVLKEHEIVWCQALHHLLRRFMVGNSEGIFKRVKEWLNDTLDESIENDKVKIHLASTDFRKITQIDMGENQNWTWVEDTALEPGAIRCECKMGVVAFSPQGKLQELEEVLETYFGKINAE